MLPCMHACMRVGMQRRDALLELRANMLYGLGADRQING